MRLFKVYLSGPISGLNDADAYNWTDYAARMLDLSNIVGYKPMRGEKPLKPGEVHKQVVSAARSKECFTRDRHDVLTADCLLVNVLGAKEKSIGTTTEMAWAHLRQIPIVLVMEEKGNVHEHGFILEEATHRCYNLDSGIDTVKTILLP